MRTGRPTKNFIPPLGLTLTLGARYLKLDASEAHAARLERAAQGALGCIPPRGDSYDWKALHARLKRVKARHPNVREIYIGGPLTSPVAVFARAVDVVAGPALFDTPMFRLLEEVDTKGGLDRRCQDPVHGKKVGIPGPKHLAREEHRDARRAERASGLQLIASEDHLPLVYAPRPCWHLIPGTLSAPAFFPTPEKCASVQRHPIPKMNLTSS
mgnify:CR=1 FL=1